MVGVAYDGSRGVASEDDLILVLGHAVDVHHVAVIIPGPR